MLGLPVLPRKLPSRNWLIFWSLSAALSAAIIYDKREKKRATAKWAHAVEHLAKDPIHNPCAMPRKLTIFLSAPPGDGLRFAQDHFTEYIKPILAASGLDWEFVQGRREGDIRAVVAERLRKVRRGWESDLTGVPQEDVPPEDVVAIVRRKNATPQYEGPNGDVVVGRNTWKEYVRGLHEGWLGPLSPPPEPEPISSLASDSGSGSTDGDAAAASPDEKKPEETDESKPKPPPPQPKPYNSPDSYPASPLPLLTPAELTPSAPIREPHILGFLNTPTRMRRFFNRRALADDIGREVAAVCLATYREFRELPDTDSSADARYEQQKTLEWEERDWVKSVWKDDEQKRSPTGDDASPAAQTPPKDPARERTWTQPVVLDSRIAMRMRRFELQPADEERARTIVVPEEEIEGFVKGNLRQLYRWGARQVAGDTKKMPPIGDDDEP